MDIPPNKVNQTCPLRSLLGFDGITILILIRIVSSSGEGCAERMSLLLTLPTMSWVTCNTRSPNPCCTAARIHWLYHHLLFCEWRNLVHSYRLDLHLLEPSSHLSLVPRITKVLTTHSHKNNKIVGKEKIKILFPFAFFLFAHFLHIVVEKGHVFPDTPSLTCHLASYLLSQLINFVP